MNVSFLSQFEKDIKKINVQSVKSAIARTIEQVEGADGLSAVLNLKKLKGFRHAYRIRIGDYRIGVLLDGDTLVFARVVHRRDVYNVFP